MQFSLFNILVLHQSSWGPDLTVVDGENARLLALSDGPAYEGFERLRIYTNHDV